MNEQDGHGEQRSQQDRWQPVWLRSPRAAYVHIPFCRRRCGYCNFTLVADRNDLIPRYLDALELEARRFDLPVEVDTLFVGGGTPSQLRGADWDRFASWVTSQFRLVTGGEWSVEVNPEDASPEYLRQLANSGVNRISLGVQSFQSAKLSTLERAHSRREAIEAVESALQQFRSVGVDLIFGAPGETLNDWQADLDAVKSLGVPHISTYGLTYDQGSAFWGRRRRGQLVQVSEDIELEMYRAAIHGLSQAGLEHYEVSNFARQGFHCRHNQCYWRGGTYHALGAGASRHLQGRRETNHRSTTQYMRLLQQGLTATQEVEEYEASRGEQKALEVLIFSLRQMAGVCRERFVADTGYDVDDIGGAVVRNFVERGWLIDSGECIRLSDDGLVVSDSLWSEMLG